MITVERNTNGQFYLVQGVYLHAQNRHIINNLSFFIFLPSLLEITSEVH